MIIYSFIDYHTSRVISIIKWLSIYTKTIVLQSQQFYYFMYYTIRPLIDLTKNSSSQHSVNKQNK